MLTHAETIVTTLTIVPAIVAIGLRTALLLGDEAAPVKNRRCRLIGNSNSNSNSTTSPTAQAIADLAGLCAVAFAATGALVLHYIG